MNVLTESSCVGMWSVIVAIPGYAPLVLIKVLKCIVFYDITLATCCVNFTLSFCLTSQFSSHVICV